VFDILSRRIPWVVAALMALAVTGAPVAAQSDVGMDPAAVSNVNAHRVDGRHAVKMTSNVDLRAGRLMAFSGQGYLPANIVQGGVATIAALQSSAGAVNEADNPVHWNQIQGVPPTIINGTTLSTLGPEATIAGGATGALLITYPATMNVHYEVYPVTPGGVIATTGDLVGRTADSTTIVKGITFANFSAAVPVTVRVRITAFNPGYVSPAKMKDRITVKFADKLPKRFRR
jgi:hypothetical protein